MAKRNEKTLLIRIPTFTWKAVKKQAEQSNRTVSAQIREILEIATLPTTGTTTGFKGNVERVPQLGDE